VPLRLWRALRARRTDSVVASSSVVYSPAIKAATAARSVWLYTRPHTIAATTASVLTLWLLAHTMQAASGLGNLALTLAICLATNVYITGINQVIDVDIDRINKPWLPVPAGRMTRTQGLALSIGCGVASLAGALVLSLPLLVTVTLGLLIGTAYSVPPLRLKRFPVAAAASIITVRGPVLTFGVYLHFAGGGPIPGSVVMLAVTAAAFALVVAMLKDVPDRRGDTAYGIRTFSTQLDVTAVHRTAMTVSVLTYVGAAFSGVWIEELNTRVLAVGELLCAVAAAVTWIGTNPPVKTSAARGYKWVWRTYYLHHLVVVAAAWIGSS
jgi:homogentisate phytyltransferase / homogentisate geranylgeranyltransferase